MRAALAVVVLTGCSPAPLVVEAPTMSDPVAIARSLEAPDAQAQAVVVEDNATPLHAGETWSGSYTCQQGITQLGLHIRRVDGHDVDATFEFVHPPSGASGEFEMRGVYTPSTHRLRFAAGDWISRPPNYVTVDIEGRISPDGRSFAGRVQGPGCGEFVVRRGP